MNWDTQVIFCVEPICQLSPPLGVFTLILTIENGVSLESSRDEPLSAIFML